MSDAAALDAYSASVVSVAESVLPSVASLPVRTARGVGVGSASPGAASGLRRGDIMVSLDGNPIVTATAVQRLMVEDAIDREIEITVWRNGALVDTFATPRELNVS